MDIENMPRLITTDKNCPCLKYRDKGTPKPGLPIVSCENRFSSIAGYARGRSDWSRS
ncbi:Uncharacterised protein [uncultured archaeon]|nr:Uncharacterised protein [uncultured archaeon]